MHFIRTLQAPIHVIAVTGVAREGKSALLSLLLRALQADEPKEDCLRRFNVSTGVETATDGIWLWASNR